MKKRILSFLLCLCLLSSISVMFASCGKKTVELAGYSVVYGADLSDSADTAVRDFASTLAGKTDGDVGVVEVASDASVADEAKNEILIGNTNRSETAKALKKIKGHGYIIAAMGGKIVIVGTTNLLTSIALDLFCDTYLAGNESVSTIKVEKTEVEKLEMLEVTKDWSFVHSQFLDGKTDLTNSLIEATKEKIPQFSSVQGKAMRQISELQTAEHEILVGAVNREERIAIASGMNANDYGVAAKNGKLIVAANGADMIEKGLNLLSDMLKDSVCEEEVEGSTKKLIFVPTEFTLIYTASDAGIVTDFPKPEGLTLAGTQDVHDSSTEYYYEGATADAYKAYCEKLVSAGYRLYGTVTEAEGSIFATYVNETANVALYVAFDNFKWVIATNSNHQKAIRIVASPLDCVNLVEEKLFTMDLSYERLQEPSITSLKADYAAGSVGGLYLVALEDGSFIVVDGGQNASSDHERLYQVMLEFYRKAKHLTLEPSADEPIRISAWYLTHGHSDHYGLMRDFIDTYCADYDTYHVTIDRLIANLPSDEEIFNASGSDKSLRDSYAELSAKVRDAANQEQGFKYYKVHTGQRFWIANVEFEVMYTHEDMYPRALHSFKDTSTVVRMHMYHTRMHQLSVNSETTMLFLGDAQTQTSLWLRTMYYEYIQSDMVQISNHALEGCESALYKLIKPVCVWWPVSRSTYQNVAHDSSSKTDYVKINRYVSYSMKSVLYCILSDICNYTLMITASGVEYRPRSAECPMGLYSAGEPNATNRSLTWGTVASYAGMQPPMTGILKTSYAS